MPSDRGSSSFRARGSRGQSRGRFRGRGASTVPKRISFKTSRIEDSEELPVNHNRLDDGGSSAPEETASDVSANENDEPPASSYVSLLKVLNVNRATEQPLRKKRKLSASQPSGTRDSSHADNIHSDDAISEVEDLADVVLAQEASSEDEETDEESDDEGHPLKDPFEAHYAIVEEALFARQTAAIREKKYAKLSTTTSPEGIRTTVLVLAEDLAQPSSLRRPQDAKLKHRLSSAGSHVLSRLDKTLQGLQSSIFGYQDQIFCSRTLQNASDLRDLVSLHTLNHVLKTRDHVIKNNARMTQLTGGEVLDIRDQGFTRPKILVLLPTRQSCVKFVESIVKLFSPDQQENKSRFNNSFAGDEDTTWEDKPDDFQDLFGSNNDDMFRLGLKFTRKSIKFFSAFYNSDIILASPLGLRTAIEFGGGGKDKKKGHDADFLSSIEITIVDQTNALLMQNWQHVEYVFSCLNQLPKESHGCDFSRVRSWYLDGNSKYLRQTIVLSEFLAPEINFLASQHFHNISGRVKTIPTYRGAMLDVPLMLSSSSSNESITQTFLRFASPSPVSDSDARFTYFQATILPALLRRSSAGDEQRGTLIFVPSYVDLIRLRNYLSTAATNVSFACLSEYTSVREVARARSHFLAGRHRLLLYGERAHHFRRYARLRGVRRVIFYGVPENPRFWVEVLRFLVVDHGDDGVGQQKDKMGQPREQVRALFSKYDALKLERIVGSDRVSRMVSEKMSGGGDRFDFV